ncbi:MAG TPA: DUF692 family multinuclear iron-containing protein [Methylocystis sp.]
MREPPGSECLGRASVGYAYLLINCPLGVRSDTNFFGERGEKWSIHLVTLPAGHTDKATHKIDTHDQPICEEAWGLYQRVCRRFGRVSTMIERDDNFPFFDDLLARLDHARSIATAASNEIAEVAV